MNAHWPKHKEYHKEQKLRAEERCEGTLPEYDRSIAEAAARRAERTGSEYYKRFAAAVALVSEGDHYAAAKAYRKIIKEWPAEPAPHHNLALVMQRTGRLMESAQMYLKAMELCEAWAGEGTRDWALAAASAFDLLRLPECSEMPKPEWWDNEGLKALSARVVAVAPNLSQSCNMRARVLSPSSSGALSKYPWKPGSRTAAEIKEAATWFRRAAMVSHTPAEKLRFEQLASARDAVADPLLADEEAQAAEARAKVKANAAEARKVAEAKATAAAEELLAEEEKEKQQVSTKSKTKQGKKGKAKGNGKR